MPNLWMVALAIFLPLKFDALAQEDRPPRLLRAVPLSGVEGRIDHLAWDSKDLHGVGAALGNNSVEIMDPGGSKANRRISGLKEPQGDLAGGDLDWIVVASAGDGSCRIYDPASLKPLKVLDYKSDADNLRYDAQEKRIYVGYGDGALGIIDAVKETKLVEIKLAGHPESFHLESKGPTTSVNVPHHAPIT